MTVFVGSLHDICLALRCPKIFYVDVAASNPLVAIRRLKLYRELRAAGAVVLREAGELRKMV